MIKIEQYNDRYLNDLTGLLNQWDPNTQFSSAYVKTQLDTVFSKSDNQVFLAINQDDKAVGYALAGICYYLAFEPFVEIIQLMVHEKYRSRKIGETLIAYISKYYKDMGITEMKLHSQLFRTRAHSFYERLGFKEYKRSIFFEKNI